MGYGGSKEQLKLKPAMKTWTEHANVEKLKRRKTLDETTMSNIGDDTPHENKKNIQKETGDIFWNDKGVKTNPKNLKTTLRITSGRDYKTFTI